VVLNPGQLPYLCFERVNSSKASTVIYLFLHVKSVLRIRIRIIWLDPDPEFWMPDPDPRLQNWHLINLFIVEKYCE
jgi:hypothetical protein